MSKDAIIVILVFFSHIYSYYFSRHFSIDSHMRLPSVGIGVLVYCKYCIYTKTYLIGPG
jgi:hypothetical protein